MSGSPRSEHFDDIYFAVEDGLEETKHVFLAGNGLPDRWQNRQTGRERFVVAETGFGTGLNFLSAWLSFEAHASAEQKLEFISFEKYPLSATQIKDYLGIWSDKIGTYLDRLVQVYPLRVTGWHKIQVTDRVSLLLIFDDVNRAIPELRTTVDAWFLDGHAPAKNPEMWSQTVFDGIARCSDHGTTFATFTAAGVAKRGMREAGFTIEKRRGFGRKRDMIVGVYEGENQGSPRQEKERAIKSVGVIGAGLAGTAVAASLHARGLHVELFEKEYIAAGASGNKRGLFNPRFTAQKGPDSDFYGAAYARAVGVLRSLDDISYQPHGSLHLVTDEDKRKRFQGLLSAWGWHSDHVVMVDAERAEEIAGIHVGTDALYLPDSGSVSPELVCQALARNIEIRIGASSSLEKNGDAWKIDGRQFDAVVIAAGIGSLEYALAEEIPLGTVRGQVTYASATVTSSKLQANVCYGGYISPVVNGEHVIGSTFQPWLTETQVREEDHDQIIGQLEDAIPSLQGEFQPLGGRAALRTSSKDRVPVIGAIAGAKTLYVSTAHGSHGLLSALLAAEVIAADISGETPILPDSVMRHISPARFVERARKKSG